MVHLAKGVTYRKKNIAADLKLNVDPVKAFYLPPLDRLGSGEGTL